VIFIGVGGATICGPLLPVMLPPDAY